MNKILIAIATAVFAVSTMLTSSAQAGFKGRLAVGLAIGALGVMAHQHHRQEQRRRWKKRHVVRRSPKVHHTEKKSAVAKVEEAPEAAPAKDVIAETENSSLTTAALPQTEEKASEPKAAVAKTAEATVEPAAATTADAPKTPQNLDCKKFFPAVGLTLSVPCE